MENNLSYKYRLIQHLNVSRETCIDFELLMDLILEQNKKINMISKNNSEKEAFRDRHIIDSAQVIDFVNLNHNTTYDIGSGAGIPGLVLAIMLKNRNKNMKFVLFEKSYRKSQFLKYASEKLNLNTEVVQKDVFKINRISAGTIISRAFKPLPIMLDLINSNFQKYTNVILFMGKSGQKILDETLKRWEINFIKIKSLTSKDSFLMNIENIKKR
tara:strand:+ start:322 stop:963 length:642 start_codon:yes stop_codon:yes gene_type:complete